MRDTLALRYLKTVVLLVTALFGTSVVLGNLMDYDSNYQFVQHVLSMDTTFAGNRLMWRAVTSPTLHSVAYWTIICAETLFASLAWIGTYRLYAHVKHRADVFNQAKSFGFLAYLTGMCIWFLGFVVIGSEWFVMWQSESWNGKQTAMDIAEVLIGFAVLLAIRDRELTD